MTSVCWYCCGGPKTVDPSMKRKLSKKSKKRALEVTATNENNYTETVTTTEEEIRHDIFLENGFYASELKMHPSNFEVNRDLEEEYLSAMERYRDLREDEDDAHRRGLQMINYDDVQYRYEIMCIFV